MDKTLAMKLLEKQNIEYEPALYPSDERDAEQIAVHFGVPAAQVFKTLVVARPPQKPLLVMVPADRQLDLKKLARIVGAKKLKMANHRQAEELTGLQVGGISPLALLGRPFVMLADSTIRNQEHVFISAGQRGINLKVPAEALLALTNAQVADVATD